MKKPAKTNPGLPLLRARIAKGGDLNPQSLSRSYGVPAADIEKLLRSNGRFS